MLRSPLTKCATLLARVCKWIAVTTRQYFPATREGLRVVVFFWKMFAVNGENSEGLIFPAQFVRRTKRVPVYEGWKRSRPDRLTRPWRWHPAPLSHKQDPLRKTFPIVVGFPRTSAYARRETDYTTWMNNFHRSLTFLSTLEYAIDFITLCVAVCPCVRVPMCPCVPVCGWHGVCFLYGMCRKSVHLCR